MGRSIDASVCLASGNGPCPFLTSDRPIIMTNGMTGPDAHFGLPIGPQLAEMQGFARPYQTA
jgi:hypothetical protein